MTDRMPLGLRLLAIVLIALVGSALLDRIPDPPTVLQKKIQAVSGIRHKGTIPAAISTTFFRTGWIAPQATAQTAVLYIGGPAERIAADHVRIAGDSSPPLTI